MAMFKRKQSISFTAASALCVMVLAGCTAIPGPAPTAMPGPQGTPETPQGCKAEQLGDDALVGQPESKATALLAGCAWRIGQRDGEMFPGTMDYLENRRTLGIVGGKVAWIKRG